MNRARVAALLRELAAEVEADEGVEVRRVPAKPLAPKGAPQVNELHRARARRGLRKVGAPIE